MFVDYRDKLICPVCKSKITVNKRIENEKENIICDKCRYSQFAKVFIDEYKMKDKKKAR